MMPLAYRHPVVGGAGASGHQVPVPDEVVVVVVEAGSALVVGWGPTGLAPGWRH